MSGIEEFTSEFFDDASAAWRANKIPIGEGSFKYKPGAFKPKPRQAELPKERSGYQTRLSVKIKLHSYNTRSKTATLPK
jgi:hypothetical protein